MTNTYSAVDFEKQLINGNDKFVWDYIDKLRQERLLDEFHQRKRLEGAYLTTLALERCDKHICPYKIINSKLLYFLSDMSLNGYVKTYGGDKKKINNIINCHRECRLADDIFKIDFHELTDPSVSLEAFLGARKRKAYWRHLSNKENSQPSHDFVTSCGYIESINSIFRQNTVNQEDIERYKKLLVDNLDIASIVDLYRLCLLKNRI